jgi:cell division protein FtsL
MLPARLSNYAFEAEENEENEVENVADKSKSVRFKGRSKLAWFVFTIAGIVTIMIILICVLFAEIAMLKNQNNSLQQHLNGQNDQLSSMSEQQVHISGLQQISQAEISVSIDQLGHALEGQHKPHPTSSCAALPSSTPSGYYWIKISNGSAVRVYCDMTRTCGGVTGGWMRVANVKSNEGCPDNLFLIGNFCRMNLSSIGGCTLVTIPTYNFNYSHVCGRMTGHRIEDPNAFLSTNFSNPLYVDGISLTHGEPRKHIWTFAAASDVRECPCGGEGSSPAPEQVGNDYFCDTAVHRLWIRDCRTSDVCCPFNNPPWFYKQLSHPTNDDIEMRVCRDQPSGYEDVIFTEQEIYVQ